MSGNVADLSQIGTADKNSVNLLIDDSGKMRDVISAVYQIDIVLDNSGEELLHDILFSHWILQKRKTAKVYLHFKTSPYFVSDALKSDFYFLLDTLSENKTGKNFSAIIHDYINKGRLVLEEDDYWTDTNDYVSTPEKHEKIKNVFSKPDLVVFKGDLNYRKLIEDRHWSHTTETEKLTRHIKTNCLIIRVLKSEIITGLKNIPCATNNEWMYNSKYGIIQFI